MGGGGERCVLSLSGGLSLEHNTSFQASCVFDRLDMNPSLKKRLMIIVMTWCILIFDMLAF